MEYIKDKLAYIGSFLASAGVFSIVLYFMDFNLRILLWIDLWGDVVGWMIRGGMVVLGAGLWLASKIIKSKTPVETTQVEA